MSVDKEKLKQQVEAIPPFIAHELERELSAHFDRCGLFYRVFSRCKSAGSTVSKMTEKEEKYRTEGKKMQDLIGIRIVLYFKDDIDLCIKIIENNYSIIEIVRDEEGSDNFRPMRLNIVCRMPDKIKSHFAPEIWDFPIDTTFEMQIRTIFSEGWHEVEHDLRYKHKTDWEAHIELSRNLNGIFATLENCDFTILNVLDQLAYQKYKRGDWEAMLRNHLRIRMDSTCLSAEIRQIFDSNQALAKDFFRVDRKMLLLHLSNPHLRPFPKTINNAVFLTNELIINNPELSKITPSLIKDHIRSIKATLKE